MTENLACALEWHTKGMSVIPVSTDGSKAPAVPWAQYQHERATAQQLVQWYTANPNYGTGIVCGAVSRNLEMTEVEGRAVAEGFLERLASAMDAAGLTELWLRIAATGYVQVSPSGGRHYVYRLADGTARGNTKLARRPATDVELAAAPRVRQYVLAETRGEGGYYVAAGTGGTVHPTGRPWVAEDPTRPVAELTAEDRDLFHAVLRTLDEMPAPAVGDTPARPPTASTGGALGGPELRPGDDYEARTDWAEILEPAGWTRARRLGNGWAWRRPDKTDPGISATTGQSADGTDRLYVFTTSTEFEAERPYSKFGAYALLSHGGDHAAAASALRHAGYGAERPTPPPLRLSVADPFGLGQAPPGGDPEPPTADRPALTVLEGGRSDDSERQAVATAARLAAETLDASDDGNALKLAAAYSDRIRYSHDRGRWYAWTGVRWAEQPRGGGDVREYAKEMARYLPDGNKTEQAWKTKSLSAVGISNTLTQAATISDLAVSYTEFDSLPYELNTPAGTIDLRSGRLVPADPTHLHTRSTSVAPDFTADRSRWLAFLADTFGGNAELIGYLQRLVGYSCVGVVGAHVLPFCHGSGGNGKGVFLEALRAILGDYATTAPSGFLMASNYASHETEIARLAGARMVICSEVNEGDRLDEAKVKTLTGGDTITARFMRQDHFTFEPSHQLWLMGNHKPEIQSGGRSIWRRLRLIPFEHEVTDEKRQDDLQGVLAREHGPSVLAWIAEGAAMYARDGLIEPRSVKAATNQYEREQNTVARYLEDGCAESSSAVVLCSHFRRAYEAWCYDEGETPTRGVAFGQAMARLGVTRERRGKNRGWHYLGWLPMTPEAGSDDT